MHFVFVIVATLIILCVGDVSGHRASRASVTPWQYDAMEAVTSTLPSAILAEGARMAGDASYLATVSATVSSEVTMTPSTMSTVTAMGSTNVKITTNKDILSTNEFVSVNDTGKLYGISTVKPSVEKVVENGGKNTDNNGKTDPKGVETSTKSYPKGDLGGLLVPKPFLSIVKQPLNNGYDHDYVNDADNYNSGDVIDNLLHYYDHYGHPAYRQNPEKSPSRTKIDLLDLIRPILYNSNTNYDYLPDK